MSNDHALQRLAILRKTSPHLVVETFTEGEGFDFQAETLCRGRLGIKEKVHGLSNLKSELSKAVSREALQRLWREGGRDELREDGSSASCDQAFLMHLELHDPIIHGNSPANGLVTEKDVRCVEIEDPSWCCILAKRRRRH